MTWDNLIAGAEALREKLGFDRWVVLGHSFGGNVAPEYELRCPEQVSHLLLMDTCGDARWMQQYAPDLLAKRGYRSAAVPEGPGLVEGAWKGTIVVPFIHPAAFDKIRRYAGRLAAEIIASVQGVAVTIPVGREFFSDLREVTRQIGRGHAPAEI